MRTAWMGAAGVVGLMATGCSEPSPAEAVAVEVCDQLDGTLDGSAGSFLGASLVIVAGYEEAPVSVNEQEYEAALQAECPDLMDEASSYDGDKAIDELLGTS